MDRLKGKKPLPDDEFIAAFDQWGASEMARRFGMNLTSIQVRRRRMEKRLGITISSPNAVPQFSESMEHPSRVQVRIEDGIVRNPSFRDYKLMTSTELPEIEYHFIENDDPEGPFGAKGIAELPAIVPAPAIANAVYNAIGVRFDNPPITPEKVAFALHGTAAK